jgi:gamma-glutamyltranspeptidase / glutathione hydrolase
MLLIRPCAALLSVLLLGCAPKALEPAAELPTPTATPAPTPIAHPGGAVASAHPTATAAGMAMLKAGGTAADAAVATALVLGVVNPQSSGLGGGGFAVVLSPTGEVTSLDFREMAPSFFDRDVYQVEGRSSSRGPWAAGIPGEPAGLAELHRRAGRLPWADVVEPARALAADGFPVGADLARMLGYAKDSILADPGLSAIFTVDGAVLAEGATAVRPALGRTLQYLQLHGGDGFYKGPLAVAFTGFLAGQGVPWTEAELASYVVRERPVVSGTYRGFGVHSMGPPSSGGLALVETLGVLEAAEHHGMPFGELVWARTLSGALSHAFADRAAWGGDPDHVDVPVDRILADGVGARLWARTPESGPVPTADAGLSGESGELGGLVPDDSGTSHLSVVDGEGMAVALTTTVNLLFGNKQLDPNTGIVLNDEMDDFAARPGEPNAFGLVQGENNAVGPGRRPLSSMTPTIVTDADGGFLLAVGGAGGPRIITGTLQTLLGVVDGGLNPQDALARARLHHQWLPTLVFAEDSLPEATRTALTEEGFALKPMKRAGVMQAVGKDPATGAFTAGADPRAGGAGDAWNP